MIGDNRKFPAALIVPNRETLEKYAKEKDIIYSNQSELCRSHELLQMIIEEVDRFTPDLANYEKIKKVALIERVRYREPRTDSYLEDKTQNNRSAL